MPLPKPEHRGFSASRGFFGFHSSLEGVTRSRVQLAANALPLGTAGALCLLLAGCLGASRPRDTTLPKPPMPTMMRSPAVAPIAVTDRELVDSILRLAREGGVAAAVRGLDRAADFTQRMRVVSDVAMTLAMQDPKLAAAFALALPEGQSQMTAIEIAAAAMTRTDPNAALRWALDRSGTVGRLAQRGPLRWHPASARAQASSPAVIPVHSSRRARHCRSAARRSMDRKDRPAPSLRPAGACAACRTRWSGYRSASQQNGI